MTTGILLDSIICFTIFLVSFYTSFSIFKNTKEDKKNLAKWQDFSYAGIWFSASLIWLFMSASLILFGQGLRTADLFLNQYFIQTAIFAEFILGGFYGFYRVFKRKMIAFIMSFSFIVPALVALFFVYQKGGLVFNASSYFSVEYLVNPISWQIFGFLIILTTVCLLYDVLKFLIIWLKQKKFRESKYFFASSAVLLYGLIGFFDEKGAITSWRMVFFRLFIIFAALIAYLAYSKSFATEEEEED